MLEPEKRILLRVSGAFTALDSSLQKDPGLLFSTFNPSTDVRWAATEVVFLQPLENKLVGQSSVSVPSQIHFPRGTSLEFCVSRLSAIFTDSNPFWGVVSLSSLP